MYRIKVKTKVLYTSIVLQRKVWGIWWFWDGWNVRSAIYESRKAEARSLVKTIADMKSIAEQNIIFDL